MGAKGMLGAMVVGTVLVIALGARRSGPHAAPAITKPVEEPWLSKEATDQIFGADGALGPLFKGVMLGGPPPSQEIRDRIAAFARANHVAIDLEVTDDTLTAIRATVEYGGCCGYEGADVLALRLQRPSTGVCCVCGPDTWINDWTILADDVDVHASIRVNRITVRWEPTMSVTAMLDAAEEIVGKPPEAVASKARDRWREVAPYRYLFELPFPAFAYLDYGSPPPLSVRTDLGMMVDVHAGRIEGVELGERVPFSDEQRAEFRKLMRKRWGRPRVRDGEWTWTKGDRVITSSDDSYFPLVEIRVRS